MKDCHRVESVSERNRPREREHQLGEGPYTPCQVKGEKVYHCGSKGLEPKGCGRNGKEEEWSREKIKVCYLRKDKSARGFVFTGSDESRG